MNNRLIIIIVSALAGLSMLSASAAPSRMPMAKLQPSMQQIQPSMQRLRPSMQKLQKAKTVPMAKLRAARGVHSEA